VQLGELLVMMIRCTVRAVLSAGMIVVPALAFAQNATKPPPHVPLQKTIGASKPDIVPSLIVMNARGAALKGQQLMLTGIMSNAIVFADRPVRSAGHAPTAVLLEEWATGSDSFAKDPPNATVSVFSKDGSEIRDAVVVLKAPHLEEDRLTFDVDVLEGDLTGADGAAAIFIDIIGLPRTPLSFAGAARRTAFRGAWYAGAGVAGAAALGAAAAAAPYYGYHPYAYRPLCGYYPYPPCY
jgi:hypothetical protein